MSDTTPSNDDNALPAINCPQCGGPSTFAKANKFRPFCSERCKLHDLGAWASESFRVEVQEHDGADEANQPPLQ